MWVGCDPQRSRRVSGALTCSDGEPRIGKTTLLEAAERMAPARPRVKSEKPTEPLTSQETRIALHAAKGMSNKETAAALFLSPKTVEHHLGSVYRKGGF